MHKKATPSDSTSTSKSFSTNGKGATDPQHVALQNLDEFFILINTKFVIVATNAAAHPRVQKFLGFEAKTGANILELVSSNEVKSIKKIYNKVFAGERLALEKKIEVSGRTTYHRIRYKPAYDNSGSLIGALVMADDITDLKNQELDLQHSEERWRFALEGSNQGLWDWNIVTGKVYFSHSWKKLFGFTDDDVIDHINQWKKRVHPQDKKKVAENLTEHFESDNPLFESVYRFQAKNGDYRWLLSRGKVLDKDAKGKPRRMIGTHTDITDMHLLEQNYKSLFDANPLPSWTYQLDTDRFINVNKAPVKLYGYSEAEFMKMSMAKLLPNHQEWQKGNKTFFKNKTYQQHLKKNGDVITVNLTCHLLDQDRSNIAIVLAEDVTEKAAAEQAIIKINERFKLASRATSDAIYDWDIEGSNLNWGDGMYTLFGYRPHEVSLQNWESYIHPDERDDVLKSLYGVINSPNKKNWRKEYRFRTAKGDYRYVVEKGFILRNKERKAIRMIGALQDITDIKQKQVELEKSNKRFDAVMKATSEFIWDWNLEDHTFYRDPDGLRKVLGVMNDDDLSDEKVWLKRIHPEDQPAALHVIENILKGKISKVFEREYRFRRDDGKYAYIHDRGIALFNGKGKLIRLVGAAQDVTLRKKLERELLQNELEKHKIISKATIDTQEQERTEIGRELHDNVNQVLTTTKLYLELAQLREEMKDEMIQKSVGNIVYVINEIRQLSRSLMNPSIGDLGLIDAIKDLINNINITRKLKVRLDTSKNVEAVLTPDLKLVVYRILQEALNNAIKHSRATNVLICIKKKENKIELIVQDDGIGFNIAGVKKGIGLKNIENRVYLINGHLQVNTAPGEGCTLIVHFPYKKNQS